ncbi:hypothetical protein ZWY2020_005822 [Hordeum vulgare]|nr:hypothetical protein ZWY2020_005822 [Hordeum vulgare]
MKKGESTTTLSTHIDSSIKTTLHPSQESGNDVHASNPLLDDHYGDADSPHSASGTRVARTKLPLGDRYVQELTAHRHAVITADAPRGDSPMLHVVAADREQGSEENLVHEISPMPTSAQVGNASMGMMMQDGLTSGDAISQHSVSGSLVDGITLSAGGRGSAPSKDLSAEVDVEGISKEAAEKASFTAVEDGGMCGKPRDTGKQVLEGPDLDTVASVGGALLLERQGRYGSPILNIKWHQTLNSTEPKLITADKHIVRVWDPNIGNNMTIIEPDNGSINDVCIFSNSGLMLLALDNSQIPAHFIPALGPAPN